MKSLLTIIAIAASVAAPGFGQLSGRSATLRGIVGRGHLGVGVLELTDDRVKALNLKDDQGLEVKHVDPNSPAEKAGVKENDVILEVNGRAIESLDQFQLLIAGMTPGTKVGLTIWRNGAKQTLSATLDSRPANIFAFGGEPDFPAPPMPPVPFNGPNGFLPAMPANSPIVGFEGEELGGSQLAAYFGVKDGVLVRSVAAKTPAERAGLKAGDVVTKVNGTPVTTPREITGLVRIGRGKPISFTVVRNKKEITLNVEIAEEQRVTPADREVL
jgi:serine protease Do